MSPLEQAEFVRGSHQAAPGLDQIYQRLKDYQCVTKDGRKKFAYACLIFDSCTDWLAKYPDESDKSIVIGLQDDAFTLIRSVGGRKWMTAMAKMSEDGKSKARRPLLLGTGLLRGRPGGSVSHVQCRGGGREAHECGPGG